MPCLNTPFRPGHEGEGQTRELHLGDVGRGPGDILRIRVVMYVNVYVYVCVYVCVYVYVCVCTCMYVCVRVCMYVYVYVCTWVCEGVHGCAWVARECTYARVCP